MLNNFNMIRSCFGPDDEDPNDPEKFEIKNKRERKVYYNPNFALNQKKRKKDKSNKSTGYNSETLTENSINKEETAPNSLRKMTLDSEMDLSSFLMSDIKEIKNDFEIEYDYGNREYKLKLCDVQEERLEGLATQMKFRLEEGGGECFYQIGVEDNGNPLGLDKNELESSVETLKKIVEKLNATATVTKVLKGKVGLIAEVFIKANEDFIKNDKLELKIGLLGQEGSGKSTLIGVLVSNKLDNGKGLARFNVFRHKHEILCGKTSSISHQILGFDENCELTNYGNLEKPSWAQIVNKSAKILNFYDMSGSNKNFKKTMTAFSPNYLDYLLLVISAETGITETTEDLLNFSLNMKLPIVTIFTKMDLISEEQRKDLIMTYKSIMNKLKITKIPILMKSNDDIVLFSRNMQEENIMPIFLVSNMNWDGLNLIKTFLSMLPVNDLHSELKSIENEKIEFDVHETLAIDSKLIVTGIVNKGKLMSGTNFYLGPDNEGKYKIVEVVNIHCKKIPVKYVYKGQYCSLYIKSENGLKKEDVRKGMVLLDINTPPVAARVFEANLWTIDGTKKVIKYKYQPVLNIKHIRQGCKIRNFNEMFTQDNNFNCNIEKIICDENVNLENVKKKLSEVMVENMKAKRKSVNKNSVLQNKNYIKENMYNDLTPTNYTVGKSVPSLNPNEAFLITSTSKTKVVFEFMFNPEYLTVGSHVIINDQLIKAYGIITKIYK